MVPGGLAMPLPTRTPPPQPLPQTAGAPVPAVSPQLLSLLSDIFNRYSEATSSDSSWEAGKQQLAELEERWQATGLSGRQAVTVLAQLRQEIAWDAMPHETFVRFYRFVFHLCKEARRKHLQVGTAIDLWRLVLTGRFRLLDRFCRFLADQHGMLHVVTEDQWRQVLDFSRTVHEDLSNFDVNSAWVCLLDDFVDHLRSAAGIRSSHSGDCCICGDAPADVPMHVVPHSGSKRRGPDLDAVTQQLLAMPLTTSQAQQHHAGTGDASCVGAMSYAGGGGANAAAHAAHCVQPSLAQPSAALVALLSPHQLPTKRLRHAHGVPGAALSGHATTFSPDATWQPQHGGASSCGTDASGRAGGCSPSPSAGSACESPVRPFAPLCHIHLQHHGLSPGFGAPTHAGVSPPAHSTDACRAFTPRDFAGAPREFAGTPLRLGDAVPSGGASPTGLHALTDDVLLTLPAVQTMSSGGGRRALRTRRSGVGDLLRSTVSDALFGPS